LLSSFGDQLVNCGISAVRTTLRDAGSMTLTFGELLLRTETKPPPATVGAAD